jgi:hypothetical protein
MRESLAPVPGWNQFGNMGEEDPKFEFWLPEYYEGMDPIVVTWMMKGAADHFGNQYSSLLDEVKIVFSARDTRSDDTQPGVLVSYSFTAPRFGTAELAQDEMRSRITKELNIKLIDSEIRLVDDHKAIFWAYDTNFQGLELRQVQYIIFDGDITWSVLYVSNKDNFEDDLSIFEQSIKTFKVRQ